MMECFTRFSAAVLVKVSEQLDVPFSERSQGQITIAIVGKSGKRTRLTLEEKLEAFRMLGSGSLPSAAMYKFGVSTSRTMTTGAMQ